MTSLMDRFIQKYGRLPTEFDSDYLEMLRMTKYRIISVPDVSPSKCANCGSTKNDGRQYVDFGLHVDWYGVVFLCSLCLHEIAREMGLFTALEKEINRLVSEQEFFKDLRSQGVTVQETVLHTFEEVKSYFDGLRSLGSDTGSSSTADVGSNKESNEPTIDRAESTASTTKSRAIKSTSVSGPKNVPSLTELLNDPRP